MITFSSPSGMSYVLKSGDVAKFHSTAYGNPATSEVQSTIASGLVALGVFDNRDGDVTGDGTAEIGVDFTRERPGRWYANDGTNPVTDLFSVAYGLADDVVTDVATGHSAVGTVLAIDSSMGVFVAY